MGNIVTFLFIVKKSVTWVFLIILININLPPKFVGLSDLYVSDVGLVGLNLHKSVQVGDTWNSKS